MLAGAAGLLPPGLMPPGSPLMPSPLGAGSPMQPMAPMQPMVPMAPAGGGFMMPDTVKVPETVPEDIAGEHAGFAGALARAHPSAAPAGG